MQWSGLALLIMVGCGILLTGLPAFLVLITAAALGALLGLATDTFSPGAARRATRPADQSV